MDLVVKLDQPDPPQDPWFGPNGPPPLVPLPDPWSNVPGGPGGPPRGRTPPPGQQTLVSSQGRWGGTPGGPNGPPTGGSPPSLQAKVDKVVDMSSSVTLSDEPPPPPPPAISQGPWGSDPGGPNGNPTGGTPPSSQIKLGNAIETSPSSAPPDQQPPLSFPQPISQNAFGITPGGPGGNPFAGKIQSPPVEKPAEPSPSSAPTNQEPPLPTTLQHATSQDQRGYTPGGPNGNPPGGSPPSEQDAKLVTVAPSSLPSSQQPPPSTSDQWCFPGGPNGPPNGPPTGGSGTPVDKVAEPSPISAIQTAPSDTKQPLTSWRQAFPQNPGLYVHIKSGEPVDIRVSPPSQQHALVQLANFPALASYPATPGQRLALEAYLLDSQIRGLSALSSRMDADVSGMDPAMSDVQKQLKHTTELLHKANEASYTLYRDVYLATISGQTGQSKDVIAEQ